VNALARKSQPWLSLLVRLGLAVVLGLAAWPKLKDLPGSQRSVALYDLFPPAIEQVIGVALPVVELALALLLLTGLLTRYAAVCFGLMLVAFTLGIISAWARGLNIDCGCFAIGEVLGPGEKAQYLAEILRDVGFMAMCAFLMVWPRSICSLDRVMGLEAQPGQTKKKDQDGEGKEQAD
jgi:uncharacterized membrane protein YphA (DoxX/SURF4 family)